MAAIARASSTDFSHRRGWPPADQPSAFRGVWNRQLLAGSGFPTTANIQPNGQTHSAAPARCLPVCCPHDQRAQRARPLSQSRWPLPWIPYPRGDGQIVLHKLLPDPADPPRRHRFICTTYVKIQHTAELAEGLALELGEVNQNTPDAAQHSADVPQTHWRRADQLWNEPQGSQAFAGAAHSLAESLPASVSTCSGHRRCRNRRRKGRGRPHICRHTSVAPTPSLAFQPHLTEWRRCRRNMNSRRPKGPHAARSSEQDFYGSRAGGYMFKPLPPIK